MEFRHDIGTHLLLAATFGLLLLSTGCSSSEAFVDYADIPGPRMTTDGVSEGESTPSPRAPGDEGTAVSAVPAETADDVQLQQTDTPQVPEAAPDTRQDVQTVSKTVGGDTDSSSGDSESDSNAVKSASQNSGADSGNVEVAVRPANSDRQLPGELQKPGVEPGEPLEIKLLVPEKRFRTEGDSESVRVTYDDLDLLKVLNMEPVPVNAVDHFPQWLKDLDGQRIRLRGFMMPTFVASGLTRFALARDNQLCCFGRDPKIYDIIDVSLAEGQTTDYIDGKPFDVEGILRIDPDGDDTELFQLYLIEDALVLK